MISIARRSVVPIVAKPRFQDETTTTSTHVDFSMPTQPKEVVTLGLVAMSLVVIGVIIAYILSS
jgi:hypothetical protein